MSDKFLTLVRKLTVIQGYAETEVSERGQKDEFYHSLTGILHNVHSGDIVILMSDFVYNWVAITAAGVYNGSSGDRTNDWEWGTVYGLLSEPRFSHRRYSLSSQTNPQGHVCITRQCLGDWSDWSQFIGVLEYSWIVNCSEKSRIVLILSSLVYIQWAILGLFQKVFLLV